MKKVLLATTVLALSATVAAAEVTVSGNGRMGVVYNGNAATDKLQFSSRIRAVFTMSGETDSGLAFGGTFRADNAGGAANGSAGNIFISGAFGKLAMGDVVSAAEEVVGDLPEIGFTDLSGGLALNANDNDVLFLTGDGNIYASANNPGALYTYSTGGLTFALGMNDGNANNATAASVGIVGGVPVVIAATPADRTRAYSLGVKYAVDAYSVSLGYEVADPSGAGASAKHLVLGGEATFGTTTVKAVIGDGSGAINGLQHYGLGVTHKLDALTLKAYVKRTEIKAGSSAAAAFGAGKATGYGIGAAYSLGGGATVEGGIVDNNVPGSKVRADLGVKFTF